MTTKRAMKIVTYNTANDMNLLGLLFDDLVRLLNPLFSFGWTISVSDKEKGILVISCKSFVVRFLMTYKWNGSLSMDNNCSLWGVALYKNMQDYALGVKLNEDAFISLTYYSGGDRTRYVKLMYGEDYFYICPLSHQDNMSAVYFVGIPDYIENKSQALPLCIMPNRRVLGYTSFYMHEKFQYFYGVYDCMIATSQYIGNVAIDSSIETELAVVHNGVFVATLPNIYHVKFSKTTPSFTSYQLGEAEIFGFKSFVNHIAGNLQLISVAYSAHAVV